jgi:hypothetical protein
MRDTTPWLVIVGDGSAPPSTMRLRCNNCGAIYDVLLPVSVSELTGFHDRIKSIHKGCKEHDPVDRRAARPGSEG